MGKPTKTDKLNALGHAIGCAKAYVLDMKARGNREWLSIAEDRLSALNAIYKDLEESKA